MRLVAVHINICQVSTVGEADIQTIKATMAASLIGTEWEGEFNMEYAWETIQREHAETLVPAGHRAADDIRWHWVTYGNIEQFFEDIKVCLVCFICSSIPLKLTHLFTQEVLLEFLFALDEQEELDDGTFAEITLIFDMLARWICFDESHHPLDNSKDASGPRAKTLAHLELSHGDARSTRSWHHVTGCYGATMAGKAIPPLRISSAAARRKAMRESRSNGWRLMHTSEANGAMTPTKMSSPGLLPPRRAR
jgi:hypothetical protein